LRLDKLWIGHFKNLTDVTINFDKTTLVTALIGQNATAKSNLIEALVSIFRNLDLKEDPAFAYRLEYVCRGKQIKIDASRSHKVQVAIDGEPVSYRSFIQDANRRYLPNNVFGYYSGPSKRLEELFNEHQDIFYHQLLKGKEAPLRPLFYARTVHSQYVLLAFFSFEEETLPQLLKDRLHITAFESATFVLKQPWWGARAKDDVFWGARGVVRVFLDHLQSLAEVSRGQPERTRVPMRRARIGERLYLRIPDLYSLRKLASKYRNNVEFFKMLESTYISDLIDELKIEVRKEGVDIKLPFSELSEGEQQLLTVLGLLRFTKEDESLFLLDEPDTHLNPAWKLEYMDLLERVVGENETIHVLIATHDPLLIGGLKKDQVQVFSLRGPERRVTISRPEEDPIGMGVAGLLTSELFGLPTTLDRVTQQKLERKRELAVKDERTEDENTELAKLNDELARMGFLSSFADPLYTQFLRALREYDEFKRPALTKEEKKKQAKIAREIVARLKLEQA